MIASIILVAIGKSSLAISRLTAPKVSCKSIHAPLKRLDAFTSSSVTAPSSFCLSKRRVSSSPPSANALTKLSLSPNCWATAILFFNDNFPSCLPTCKSASLPSFVGLTQIPNCFAISTNAPPPVLS